MGHGAPWFRNAKALNGTESGHRLEIQLGKSDILDRSDARKAFIELAISCDVLKFGTFELKSGRMSPYFFNAGAFSSGAALATVVGVLIEVPLMLMLVRFCLGTRRWFPHDPMEKVK